MAVYAHVASGWSEVCTQGKLNQPASRRIRGCQRQWQGRSLLKVLSLHLSRIKAATLNRWNNKSVNSVSVKDSVYQHLSVLENTI